MENGKENICPSPFYTLQSLQADFSNYASQIHGCASLDTVWNVQFTCEKYFEILKKKFLKTSHGRQPMQDTRQAVQYL